MKNWKVRYVNFPKTGSGKKNAVDVNKFGIASSIAYGKTKQAKKEQFILCQKLKVIKKFISFINIRIQFNFKSTTYLFIKKNIEIC